MPCSWRILLQPSCSVNDLEDIITSPENEDFSPQPYNEILPGLILGDSATALSTYKLRQLGVTHVLNVAQAPREQNFSKIYSKMQDWGDVGGMVRTSESYYKHLGFKFMGIPAMDTISYRINDYFQQAADFIDEALKSEGKVFVHCYAGISRSASLVIAFLMIKHNMTAQEATHITRAKRPVRPNNGFLQQLCDLNEQLLCERRRQRPS